MIKGRSLSILACLLAGCAQISGLSELGVCDGSSCEDATVNADSSTPDAMTDVVLPLDASEPRDVYIDITCTQPHDCLDAGVVISADASVCCELFALTGKPCEITSDITQCKAAGNCATNFPQGNCGMGVVRRCTMNNDCSESMFPRCCTIEELDAAIQICANPLIALSLDGSCM